MLVPAYNVREGERQYMEIDRFINVHVKKNIVYNLSALNSYVDQRRTLSCHRDPFNSS